VLPEIAVAKIREDAPFDKVCYIGCGVTTGIGAVLNTARWSPAPRLSCSGWRHRPQRPPGIAARRRRHDHRRRHQQRQEGMGERFGMTHFVNPKEVGGDLVAHLVNMTKQRRRPDRRRRLHLRLHGNITVMRQALEAATAAGGNPSSSASPPPARRSQRGRSSW